MNCSLGKVGHEPMLVDRPVEKALPAKNQLKKQVPAGNTLQKYSTQS
jgi:hypothetical protein